MILIDVEERVLAVKPEQVFKNTDESPNASLFSVFFLQCVSEFLRGKYDTDPNYEPASFHMMANYVNSILLCSSYLRMVRIL